MGENYEPEPLRPHVTPVAAFDSDEPIDSED
jgi:hypothetical protein